MITVIKKCKTCGEMFTAHSNHKFYCDECKEKTIKDKWNKNRRHNAICDYCGKSYYLRPSDNKKSKQNCCSDECKYRLWHKQGIKFYWKVFAEGHNIKNMGEWLYKQHWIKEKSINELSKEMGMNRESLMRLFDKFKVKRRGHSQSNIVHAKKLSPMQRKINAMNAHIEIKRKWEEEPEWVAKTLKNMLENQITYDTSIEIAVQKELDKRKIEYVKQHQICRWLIDITFPKQKLAVEVDGDYWHSLPKQIEKDKRKDHWLKAHNWKILRLKEHDINKDVAECVDRIEKILNQF